MGQSAAETVKEIEEIRGRLTEELSELQERLPAPAVWAKRAVGVAVGGGLAGSAFWFLARRARRRRRANGPRVEAVVQVLPERWAERLGEAIERGRWRGWVGAAAGAWLMLRLAEVRQLRRLNRSLLAERAWRG